MEQDTSVGAHGSRCKSEDDEMTKRVEKSLARVTEIHEKYGFGWLKPEKFLCTGKNLIRYINSNFPEGMAVPRARLVVMKSFLSELIHAGFLVERCRQYVNVFTIYLFWNKKEKNILVPTRSDFFERLKTLKTDSKLPHLFFTMRDSEVGLQTMLSVLVSDRPTTPDEFTAVQQMQSLKKPLKKEPMDEPEQPQEPTGFLTAWMVPAKENPFRYMDVDGRTRELLISADCKSMIEEMPRDPYMILKRLVARVDVVVTGKSVSDREVVLLHNISLFLHEFSCYFSVAVARFWQILRGVRNPEKRKKLPEDFVWPSGLDVLRANRVMVLLQIACNSFLNTKLVALVPAGCMAYVCVHPDPAVIDTFYEQHMEKFRSVRTFVQSMDKFEKIQGACFKDMEAIPLNHGCMSYGMATILLSEFPTARERLAVAWNWLYKTDLQTTRFQLTARVKDLMGDADATTEFLLQYFDSFALLGDLE